LDEGEHVVAGRVATRLDPGWHDKREGTPFDGRGSRRQELRSTGAPPADVADGCETHPSWLAADREREGSIEEADVRKPSFARWAAAMLAASVAGGEVAAATAASPTSKPTLAAVLRSDASAKEEARTAETIAATYSVEHGGSFKGLTVAKIERLDPSARSSKISRLVSVTAHATSFRLTTRSQLTRETFSIIWSPSGKVTMSCSAGVGCTDGTW
jgi:hypothetical protein